ncbi:SIS domain-containing protein [Alphaproteobacteria bacterium]|nr:SIS domain-containing protein [Alphaproteobacteria bacterium]
MENNFKKNIEESIKLKKLLLEKKFINQLEEIGDELFETIINENKLIFCGNGGSAADAQHLVAELLIRFRSNINRKPLAAISLVQDTSTITACGNDYGFEFLFERNLRALGKKGDLLICISTSGNSKNLLLAADRAHYLGIKVIGLLGNKGGNLGKKCNFSLIVPSSETARIQEAHITIGHALIEYLENRLLQAKLIENEI